MKISKLHLFCWEKKNSQILLYFLQWEGLILYFHRSARWIFWSKWKWYQENDDRSPEESVCIQSNVILWFVYFFFLTLDLLFVYCLFILCLLFIYFNFIVYVSLIYCLFILNILFIHPLFFRQSEADQPLLTKSMIQERLEAKYSRYQQVVLRFQFPDKVVLQGLFRPKETGKESDPMETAHISF